MGTIADGKEGGAIAKKIQRVEEKRIKSKKKSLEKTMYCERYRKGQEEEKKEEKDKLHYLRLKLHSLRQNLYYLG